MSSRADATLPATRRTRKSLGSQSPSRKAADKENATIDVGSTSTAGRKKSRSKSIGPGGLDILKPGAGNRRVSLAAPSRPPPRSILKTAITYLPEIPPHKPKNPETQRESTASAASSSSDADNSGSGTKIALRTEEEQHAAARAREEKERAEAEKEAKDRREARRKSLANRRVSFAAEATLHTFHEIEYMQDSTTSTESTRRASSVAGQSPGSRIQDHLGSDASEPPSTPDGQAESPRNSQQKKRRRSSGIPPLNFNNPEDDTLGSTVYSSDSENADGVAEIHGEEVSGSDSDSDEDGTVMTVDADEMTSASIASVQSTASSNSTSLDENLRLAAQRAVTQQLDEDEEEIPAFAGWGKKSKALSDAAPKQSPGQSEDGTQMDMDMDMDMDAGMDMDITSAVGRIIKPQTPSPLQEEDQDEDMSMDVTRAMGGIISQARPPTHIQSKVSPQPQADEDLSLGEETMELTTAVGGIRSGRFSTDSQADLEGHEDMSMELTTALGGVLASKKDSTQSRRRTISFQDKGANDDATMDMTVGVGRIIQSSSQKGEDSDATMGMDMTMALGGIIKPSPSSDARSAARKAMEQEADEPDAPGIAPIEEAKPLSQKPASSVVDETGSPSLAFRGKGLRRTPARAAATNRRSSNASAAATPKTATPSKKGSSTTPSPKGPPPRMIGSRSSSPARRSTPQRPTTPQSSRRKSKDTSLFHQDPATGVTTPRVVLTPQRRRLSGVGIDRSGLGSPKIAEILDRRDSIGNSAEAFAPRHDNEVRKGVVFADPRVLETEIDRERQEEEDRENKRKILEREADGAQDDQEPTLNLKEMIEGLTPRKNPLKGRKSLHVGSAKGLLGKRPAELDDEDGAEEQDGVKRLRGHQGSPVKNIRLQSPPSKAETTGRATRASRQHTGPTSGNTVTPTIARSPTKTTTPRSQPRFKNVDEDKPLTSIDFNSDAPHDAAEAEAEVEAAENGDEERIHLQDFLNMTSIRFMELTTTKRRHTIAPSALKGSESADDKDDLSLESCVVAGACTVPMLELYQHSCRELKNYISEGRRIVREIESETFEENPPLFREYMSASPDFRVIMDNQFKNVKTHARLLSKAMWYEWRMKLQDGLKEGLVKIAEGMEADDSLLSKQEALLASVVPEMTKRYEALEQEHASLEAVARELADCDPSELEDARAELVALDTDIETKTRKIEELRQQLQESEDSIATMVSQKQTCLEDIKASEKIREECRGWSSTEIMALKAKVDKLEKQHGWAITGITGTTVSMAYRREIELVFDVSTFLSQERDSRRKSSKSNSDSFCIDLWYIASSPTPEKEFFLQCIRDQVRWSVHQQSKAGLTSPSRMLSMVSASWDRANAVANQVRLLNVTFPTTVSKTSDSSIAIRSSLLLAPLESRVEVVLNLHHQLVRAADDDRVGGVEIAIVPQAEVVYGEQFKVGKVAEFLATRIGTRVLGREEMKKAEESWCDVVVELYGRLLARGRR